MQSKAVVMNEPSCCAGLSQWLKPAFFKALADPNRASILEFLAQDGSERSVSEVARCCPVDLSVVSRHLGVLRNAGIVEAEKRGKEVIYRLRVAELISMLRGLADALEECCPDGTCVVNETQGEIHE